MSNGLDPFLESLFGKAERALDEREFSTALLEKLQRIQRRRTRRRIVVALGAAAAAAVAMPMVLEYTASCVRVAMSWMQIAPVSVYWTVSTVIGVWVIFRTCRFGRP